MGSNRANIAETHGYYGTQAQRSPADARRHLVAAAYRGALERLARAFWSMEDRLRLLSKLARRWNLRPCPSRASDSLGSRRSDRLGFVVYRRFFCSGISGRCWRFKKSIELHIDEPQDHALGRSRGGFGSKFHLVTDGRGLPLAVEVTAGQRHESTQVELVLNGIAIPQPVGRARCRPKRLAGDKGYSYPNVRQWLRSHGITPVIPWRSNQQSRHHSFDKQLYKRRSVIEQCVGWLKECRRIATRFEKLAISYLAMFKLAMVERYLRIAFSDRS